MSNSIVKPIIDGPFNDLSKQTYRCPCGEWSFAMPAVGPFGNTSAKARIAQAEMAFQKHVKARHADQLTVKP